MSPPPRRRSRPSPPPTEPVLAVRGRAEDPHADQSVTSAVAEWTRESGHPALRVWRPHPHVAFGPRDAAAPGYDRARAAAEAAGLPPIERSAGGRAVAFTGSTVAVAHAVPVADPRSGLDDRYAGAVASLQRALRRLGVRANAREPHGAFCPGGHSLSRDGKLAGVAQRVSEGVAVVGAVVLVEDHAGVAAVLGPVYEALAIPLDPDAVGSIARAGGRAEPDAVVDTVEAAFADAWRGAVEVAPAGRFAAPGAGA